MRARGQPVVVLLALLLLQCAPTGLAQQAGGRLLVRFKSGSTLKGQAETRLGVRRQRRVGSSGAELYTVVDSTPTEQKLKQLKQSPDVERVELDQRVYPTQQALPNDPLYWQQWHLPKISAPAAWAITPGVTEVKVCVPDSGALMNHPDLAANFGGGFNLIPVDQSNPSSRIPALGSSEFYVFNDTLGHGTHTAGLVAAAGNNGVGVSGVSWNVKVIPCRFLYDKDGGYLSDAMTCLSLCRDAGALISSNSWGGLKDPSDFLYEEIQKAGEAGQLVIIAAANAGVNMDTTPQYPAAYATSLDNMIAVAATDTNDYLTSWSNYGGASVHLAAPGDQLLSTIRTGGYGPMSGTSMACPVVAGAAALVQSMAARYGVTLTYQRIKYHLLRSVDPVPQLAGKVTTGGRLNVAKAVQSVLDELDPLGTYNIRQSIYTRAPSCVAWSRRSRAAYQAAAAAATGTQSITLTCQLAGLPAGKTGVRRLRVTVLAEVVGMRVSAAWDLAYKLNGLVANGTFKQMVRAQKKTAFVPRLGDGFCVEGIMTCPPALPSMGS